MKLQEFCDTLSGMFDKDRYDVDIEHQMEEDRAYVVMTFTCKGCCMYTTEDIGLSRTIFLSNHYASFLAKKMKGVLKFCDCPATVTSVKPEKKKIKQRVRRKIRV